jgi:hypothetical protein
MCDLYKMLRTFLGTKGILEKTLMHGKTMILTNLECNMCMTKHIG